MTSGCRFRFIKSVTVKVRLKKKKKKRPNNKQMRNSLKGFSNYHLSQEVTGTRGTSPVQEGKTKTYQMNTLPKTSLHLKDETPEPETLLRYFNKNTIFQFKLVGFRIWSVFYVWILRRECLKFRELPSISPWTPSQWLDLMILSSFPTQEQQKP